jgi:hypothetical protein
VATLPFKVCTKGVHGYTLENGFGLSAMLKVLYLELDISLLVYTSEERGLRGVAGPFMVQPPTLPDPPVYVSETDL